MAKILNKYKLTDSTYELRIEAPEIAKKSKPGMFLIIRIDKHGERIPLSIADWDNDSVTIVVTIAGDTTKQLCSMDEGDSILDVAGPLGNPADIQMFGTVVLIGGGCATAPIYSEAKAYREAGNKIIIIMGARSSNLLVWENQMRKVSDELIITTDDGTKGQKGFVTDTLKDIMAREKIGLVVAIGPVIMMKFVSLTTKDAEIKTIVSLNPIMVDGIGMCGACRVSVANKNKFSCVDGPEFDGHEVDWDNLIARNKCYDGCCK